MDVVRETCIKYPGGPTRIRVTDIIYIEPVPGAVLSRIKPLPLANGHGRYMTVTPERTRGSVGEWPVPVMYQIPVPLIRVRPPGHGGSEEAN
jgi:hypothetical protein